MSPDTSVRTVLARLFRGALPWVLALAVATCTDDTTGPSKGGVGYFAFRPVYAGVTSSLSQFGIVADSVHVLLTRPVDEVVLDTTVFFPPDSLELRMALPVSLEQSPETLTAMIQIKSGGVVLFVDTLDVQVVDGPPNASSIATATLDYVGPGNNIKAITVLPPDTTIFFGDTLFYTSTAIDSSDAPVVSYYVAWQTSDTSVAKVNAQGRLIAPNVRGTLKVIGRTPTGIADTADITFAPVPSQILADSGAAQSGQAGDSLATLFVAQVRAADNLPIEGIHVRFTVSAGGAVRDTLLVSDVNGRVRTRGLLGTATGAYTWTATVVGTAISTTFTGTAAAGAPSSIAISAGNGQVDSAGRALPVSLAARVADAFNNPVPGVKVYWNRTVGSGTVALDSSLTNASGVASTGYTLGAVGVDSITATIAGTSAFVAFQATAINGAPASMVKNFGDAQTDTVGRLLTDSLVVIVRSATSQPVVGRAVVWTVLRGGSTSSDTAFTDVTGRAAVAYTLGTVTGADSVRAQAGGASAVFTANALTGAVATLGIVSGDGQTDTTGYVLPLPFVVRATDTFGNAVAGTGIIFTRTHGTGTLADDTVTTDASGDASVGYTLGSAGTDTITATPLCHCDIVTFTATAVSAAPASIVAIGGDSQTVVVNTVADTFEVLVRDGSSNPVAGAKVNWAFIPAVGNFTEILPAGIQQSFTDSLGVARGIYTAGTSAGTVRVEASIAGHIDSLYVFAVAAAPSSIAIGSGDLQVDTIYHTIDVPFVAHVADAFGNPVAGAKVAFTKVGGAAGTLFADSVATNAAGDAAVGYLHGGVPGTDTIRATLAGTAAFIDFRAIAVAGTPASVNNPLGDGQTDTVRAALATPLSLEVLDAGGHPVPGAVVTFSTTAGAAQFAPATDTAGVDGVVSSVVTLGDSAGTFDITAQIQGSALNTHFTLVATHGAPALIAKTGGDLQTDTAGVTLPVALQVRATDAYANPISGTKVAFTRIGGNGSVTPDTATTDGSGFASASYTLGGIPGVDTIRAVLVANGAQVLFTEATVAAIPASLIAASGNGQSQTVGLPLTDSLVARVYDAGSVPIAGIPLVWRVLRGGSVSSDTVVSDSLGFVYTFYTTGTVSGTDSVRVATLDSSVTAVFTVSALAGAPSAISLVSGDAQVDTTGRTLPLPFTAFVGDAYGNPVVNAAVTFTTIAGGGTPAQDTAYTDAAGHAVMNYTLSPIPEADTVRAQLVGTSAFVNFTATGIAAVPASIIAHSGNGQTVAVTGAVTDSLVVEVLDGNDAPIVNQPVVWTMAAGGTLSADTTLTDLNGRAWVRVTADTAAGTFPVQAQVAGLGSPATFQVNVLAGPAALLAQVSGDGQTDTTTVPLAAPFVVRVTDAYHNPVLGAAVLWTVQAGTGTADDDTTFSDVAGQTQVNYTLGSVPAAEVVRATLVGTGTFVDFTANTVTGAPAYLAKILGDGQVDTVLATLADSFVVELRDVRNTPVPNTWLHWVTAGATASSDSTLTDAAGRAAVRVTLGSVKVPVSVIVFNADTTIASAYTVAVRAGKAAQLTAVGGLGQSGIVDSALALPFGALVQDAYGNTADSGVKVSWTDLHGFAAAGLPDTTATDSTGVAFLTAPRLGPVVGEDSLIAQILVAGDTALFTATADPGAAGSLAYVGGTGQSGTVGNMLPTQFNVQVTDAGSNPVPGAWVHWTIIAGNGSFPVDSAQTDGGGIAKITMTLGTTAGIDSAIATVTGVTDTVTFYAQANAGPAATLTLVSGDQQAGDVQANLAAPMVVLATDQYGNPVFGVDVDFGFSGGPGGGVANPSTTTDSSGHASTGTVNLSANAGTSFLEATSTTVPTDTVRFVLFAVPVGTNSRWIGATNIDWSEPTNWAPAVVPTATDNVYIPWGTYAAPNLIAASAVNDLTVEANAFLDVGSSTLTVNGDLQVDGTLLGSSGGHTILAGASKTARGNMGPIEVTGDYDLGGPTDITALQLTTGTLTVNGQTLTVFGQLDVTGTGALRMVNATDSVRISGAANWGGSGAPGLLTAGTIVFDGNFDAGAATVYQASGTHKSVFNGPVGGQSLRFGAAGLGGNQFQDVVFQSVGGVSSSGDIAVAGNAVVVAGGIDGTGYTAILGGSLDLLGGLAPWTWNTTRVEGSPTTFPTVINGDLAVGGSASFGLPNDVSVTGNFSQDAGSFSVNGRTLDISGTTTISGTAQFGVPAGSSVAAFHGAVTWDGDVSGGFLSGGEMQFYGDLTVPTAGAFQSSGSGVIRFLGTGPQSVTLAAAALNGNRFANVEFSNTAGVSVLSDLAVEGTATTNEQVTISVPHTAILGGALATPNGDAAWDVAHTVITGTNAGIPDTLTKDVEFTGTFALSQPLTVLGSFAVSNGAFAVNGNTLAVGGSFDVSGGAQFQMQSSNDSVDISGAATWNGATTAGDLTAGILVLRGDFSAASADVFQAVGTHRTRLAGTANQNLTVTSAGLTGNRFHDLFLANPVSVSLSSSIAVEGSAASEGTPGYLSGSNQAVILGGGLTDPGAFWRPDTIEFAGNTTDLPADIYANLRVSGTVDPTADVHVHYGLEVTGNFHPQHHFIVDNDFAVTGSGLLWMQGADDTLEVGGNATFDGGTTSGTLSMGTLLLHGDFSETSAGDAYQSAAPHQTVFAGTASQIFQITGSSITGDRFGDLIIDNPSGVVAGSDFYVNDVAEVRQGTIAGAGRAYVNFGIIDTTIVGWQIDYTTFLSVPTALPDSFQRNIEFQAGLTLDKPMVAKAGLTVGNGNFVPNGYPLRVDSNLTVTGNSLLVMQNGGDSVEVFGVAIIEGLPVASYLTEGVLALHHGLTANDGVPTFQATANHRTRLMGDGIIDLGFTGDGGNFNHLEIDPGITLTVKGEVTAIGTTTKAAGATTTFHGVNGVRTLHLTGASLDGAVFDSVALAINAQGLPSLDNLVMQGQDSTGTSISVRSGGIEGSVTFDNIQFPGVYTSGKMMSVEDASADGFPVRVKMTNSSPLDGTPYEAEINNGDNVYLDWSRLVYQSQPLDVAAAGTLAPVTLRVVDPDGATLTSFTGDVTLAIGSNPSGGTLGGTLTATASSGVATFSDLTIDNVGSGYTLDGSSPGLVTIGSDPFAVTVPLPVGFTMLWTGAVDGDWANGGNWNTLTAPTATDNVFIPATYANAPTSTVNTEVNRLQVASGATLTVTGSTLQADSTVEALGLIDGTGTVVFYGTGDISGNYSTSADVQGTYLSAGVVNFNFNLDITGRFEVDDDSVNVLGLLRTNAGTGVLAMTSPTAKVYVDGPVQFDGGSTSGQLTDGTLSVTGNFTAAGSHVDAFAPAPAHTTVLGGTGLQDIVLLTPDTALGNHFGHLQVSTTGTAFSHMPLWVTGGLMVTNGATLADSILSGVAVLGLTQVDAGGFLNVSHVAMAGALSAAVGSTYSVPLTVYFGDIVALPVNAAPYDTLQISTDAVASENFLVTGDLRIMDWMGGVPARFDLGGRKVTVGTDVNINGNGALAMENAADSLLVTGSFFTNGASTDGLLTAGWLRIGGSFRQAADGSGESFRAGPNHTTEFYYGGPTGRSIKFDAPSSGPTDPNNSHFGALLLPIGYDTLDGRVPASGKVFLAAAVVQDTSNFNNVLAGYDSVYISSASPKIELAILEVWGGLGADVGAPFDVHITRLFGGSGPLPQLAYQDLQIGRTGDYTLAADQVVTGTLTLGIYCSEVCTSQPGKLTVGGHTLTAADLGVMGLGKLAMATGDSVDVGAATFRSTLTQSDLAGGTLVVRGLFNEVGTDAFQADPAHRTVLLAPGQSDIYTVTNSWFGKLYVLDGGPRRLRSSAPLRVLDSLVLGASTAAVSDTLGFGGGSIEAKGPVFTVAGSDLTMDGSVEFGDDSVKIFGGYTAATTIFSGTTQPIPALTYQHIAVQGSAFLTAPLDNTGYNVGIYEGVVPTDLDLAGHRLVTGTLTTDGHATLTMASAADTLVARGGVNFNGGNESGRLTAGVLQVYSSFTQSNTYSDSSFVATGTHETRFDDSSGTQFINPTTMFAGASRFNHLTVTGQSAWFTNQGWVGGAVTIANPTSTVTGGTVNIDGALTDPYYHWNVDTTMVWSHTTVLPDSLRNNVIFPVEDTLTLPLLRVGGTMWIQDTFVVNGNLLVAHGTLKVTGPGVLQMTNGNDQVTVDGQAEFEGAVSTGLMSEGRLTLKGDLVTGNVTAGSFDPTGNHVTVLAGTSQQNLLFMNGPQGFGPNQLVTFNPNVNIPVGMKVKGTFKDSVEATTLYLTSNSQLLDVGQMEASNVDLTDLNVQMGDQSVFDTATFHFNSPQSGYALSVVGPGRATPLDLHAINFFDYYQSPILLWVGDTAENANGIDVRMFGSTPFDGSSKTLLSGLNPTTAQWSKLTIATAFPLSIDSVVPFDLTMVVKEPDGSNRADVIASLSAGLLTNPENVVLSGSTAASFDGQSANFFGMHVDTVATGVVLHVEVQGRPMDFAETAPFNVVNPAPAGAVIFTGLTSTDWSDPSNWSTTSLPSPAQDVFIPGGQSVSLPPSNLYSVNTLVLGSGAHLDLGFGSTLTVTGNAYAGQTITGAGTVEIAGGASQISGTFPSLKVTGNASAVGRTTIAGDLIVDGAGAEFNVGGQKVDVTNTLFTQNGGLLTMDGAADTLFISSGSFAGGDETNRLTDGVLIVQGSNFDQGFGDAKSFYATGTHTTIFANGGTSTAVNISDPQSSQFSLVSVQNPAGVDFTESGLGFVQIGTGLSVSAGGVFVGDTISVGGNGLTIAQPGDSVDIGRLSTYGALQVNGGYNVRITELTGPLVIPALPYQDLRINGTGSSLGASIDAHDVTVNGQNLQLSQHTLHAANFSTQGTGSLMMVYAEDSVQVDTNATMNGAPGILSNGVIEVRGSIQTYNGGAMQAAGQHKLLFTGSGTRTLNLSFACEGPCFGPTPNFGNIEVQADTLRIIDSGNRGTSILSDLRVRNGALLRALGGGQVVSVQGTAVVDTTANLRLNHLRVVGALDYRGTADTQYQVTTTEYVGPPTQHVTTAPYNKLVINSEAVLDSTVTAWQVQVLGSATLTLGGHTLYSFGNFDVSDYAHLVMQNELDTLLVDGVATFAGDDATGDYTAGAISAARFITETGASNNDASFIQTGTNRLVPLAGDTIEMRNAGPAGSKLQSLVLSTVGGQVFVGDVWISDSLVVDGPSEGLESIEGSFQVTVGYPGGNAGTFYMTDGTVHVDRFAVAGGFIKMDGTYDVQLTKFIGAGQLIPGGMPYNDVEVQYGAALAGNVTLIEGGTFKVTNFGNLDLAGYKLSATDFQTNGYGQLTMASDADTLTSYSVTFAGDSTNLSLTAGTIVTQFLSQDGTNNPRSYAPTGTHRLVLQNLGTAGDGVGVSFGSGSASESHANILVAEDYGVIMTGEIYAMDTLKINVPVNAQGSQSVYAYGPAIFGPNAEPNFDTLFVFDTLSVTVDTANGHYYGVNATVFMPSAKPFGDIGLLNDVIIEGSQALTQPLTLDANFTVRNSGALVPTGQKVRVNTLELTDQGGLVMVPGDTVEVGTANIHGGSGGGSLDGGILRIRDGLFVSNGTFGSDTYKPAGMVTEFYGGGIAQLSMAVTSPDYQFIDTLRVVGGTTIRPGPTLLAMGPSTFKDGSELDGGNAFGALDLRGGAIFLDSSGVLTPYNATVFVSESLKVTSPGRFMAGGVYLQNLNDIPNLPYQYLTIGDGVHDTLSHDLSVAYQLILTAQAADTMDLVLNGHTITTPDFSVGGYARITMDNAADTLLVNGPALFGGDDETGRLTAGVIRVSGTLTQNSSTSPNSFAVDGTTVEFFGGGSYGANFASPNQSHFAGLSVLDGGTLQPATSFTALGRVTVDTLSTLDGSLLGPSDALDFKGKVDLLYSSQVTNTGFASFIFGDSLLAAPTAGYSVVNTAFQGTNGIPDLAYTHLYLRQGVHLTLTHRLFMFGGLNIQNPLNSADTVRIRLAGNKITAQGMYVDGYARITMDNAADTLQINGDITFRGVDQDTAMSAGVIRLGGNLTQDALHSARSFAPAGTRTEFYGLNTTHTFTFGSPATNNSHFAAVDIIDNGTLRTTGSFTATGLFHVASGAHFDAGAMPGGTVADFFGPVQIDGGGDFHSFGTAFMNFYGTGSLSIGTGAPLPFFATNTGLVDNHDVPDLGYVNLYLAGTDSIRSNDVTASRNIFVNGTAVLDNGRTLHATWNMEIDGGTMKNENGNLVVDSTFSTVNFGTYVSQSTFAGATLNHVLWNGGNETGLLTAGGMDVRGDFTALSAGPTFKADSLYTVNFTGDTLHTVILSAPSSQTFGELSAQSESADGDTVYFSFAGDVNAYKLTASSQPRFIANGQNIYTEQLNVTSAIFQQTAVHVIANSAQPMLFNNATFTGFSATDVQLFIEHPGKTIPTPYVFNNIDFDNIANGSTGFGIMATDNNTGDGNALHIELANSLDNGILALLKAISPATIIYTVP